MIIDDATDLRHNVSFHREKGRISASEIGRERCIVSRSVPCQGRPRNRQTRDGRGAGGKRRRERVAPVTFSEETVVAPADSVEESVVAPVTPSVDVRAAVPADSVDESVVAPVTPNVDVQDVGREIVTVPPPLIVRPEEFESIRLRKPEPAKPKSIYDEFVVRLP